jgi:hypothetical protein
VARLGKLGTAVVPGLFAGETYLDRAAPRLAPEKFLALVFMPGPFIEPAPGSKCPGWIGWSGRSALDSRFLDFCADFAFARWRALALVMSSSPFQIALRILDDPPSQSVKPFYQVSRTRSRP